MLLQPHEYRELFDRARAECEVLQVVNDAMREALEAFLRSPSRGSGGPGSVTIEVTTFNLNAARAALAMLPKGGA